MAFHVWIFPAGLPDVMHGLHMLMHSHPGDGAALHIWEVGGVELDMQARKIVANPH